jgi:hypothetical protein
VTKPNQTQSEEVVRFLSYVQNLAEINQLTFANPTYLNPTRKNCQVLLLRSEPLEINQLTFANPTKPNQKKLLGSFPSFKTLQKSIN